MCDCASPSPPVSWLVRSRMARLSIHSKPIFNPDFKLFQLVLVFPLPFLHTICNWFIKHLINSLTWKLMVYILVTLLVDKKPVNPLVLVIIILSNYFAAEETAFYPPELWEVRLTLPSFIKHHLLLVNVIDLHRTVPDTSLCNLSVSLNHNNHVIETQTQKGYAHIGRMVEWFAHCK